MTNADQRDILLSQLEAQAGAYNRRMCYQPSSLDLVRACQAKEARHWIVPLLMLAAIFRPGGPLVRNA